MMGTTGKMGRREALVSVGFKLQTIFSCIRGMVDTMGRISGVSDHIIAPGVTFHVF